MTEHWWDIPIPTRTPYQASSQGRIRNKSTGRFRKLFPDKEGYLEVVLCEKSYRVHRLIALTFLGEGKAGLHVAHVDGDHTNNRAGNLRYATAVENEADKRAHGTYRAKLSEYDVLGVRLMLADGYTQTQVSERFGITQQYVSSIKRGLDR